MTSLKDSDLFLMQRGPEVYSFNGTDFKDIIVDASQDTINDLTDKIDFVDDRVDDLTERVVYNENTIDIISEAVDTLLKTSTKAKLISYEFADNQVELPAGRFFMTNEADQNALLFSETKTLHISATTSDWSIDDQDVETIHTWADLRLKGQTADGAVDVNEIGDYIQVFNASQSGYGLFSLLTKEAVTAEGGVILGYKFGVEYVKGDGGEVTNFAELGVGPASRVVVLGIQTKVGLDIEQADDRYLVKLVGGVVNGDTEYKKELQVGTDLVHSTESTYLTGGPVFTVRCKESVADADDIIHRKFQVRSNGEILTGSHFIPSHDLHVTNVKYVRSNYLTENGSEIGSINANFIYLRLDGTNKMKSGITFTGEVTSGEIIKIESIPGGTASINTTNNNLNITISYDNSFTIGLMDYNTFTWFKGKATASETHHTFCMSNYKNPSNERYLATLGSVNKALEDYPLPEKGTRKIFGLVKLSDSIDNSSNGDNGVASSQKAVHDVNIKIYRGMPVVKESSTAKSQAVGGFRYSNGNLYYRVN